MNTLTTTKRGTSNGNARGNTADRRARRAFLLETYASNVPGFCRCYRCGGLLYNPDDKPAQVLAFGEDREVIPSYTLQVVRVQPLTIDRIVPGCKNGTYRRNNIRPACGSCNSETGGPLATPRRKA